MSSKTTFKIEDKCLPPFFVKQKISVEKGEGIYVWDEEGKMYIDFTAGWGVTCIGHANPVITDALIGSGKKDNSKPQFRAYIFSCTCTSPILTGRNSTSQSYKSIFHK